MAPRIPAEPVSVDRKLADKLNEDLDQQNNFFIPIEQVRWFYKEEKSKHASTSGANATATTSTTTTAGISGGSSIAATNNSNSLANLQNVAFSASANIASVLSTTASSPVDDLINSPFAEAAAAAQSPTTTTSSNSKNWQTFNKWDSYNLEVEYREMMTLSKKSSSAYENNKLVQVLNNLYEVDLIKKRCSPIYWDSGKLIIFITISYYI